MGKNKTDDWHKKIAKNRGQEWRKNVVEGRRRVLLNPSQVRQARIRRNLHQAVIAQKIAVSESTFGAIERGQQPVREEKARKIAELLGVPMTKLFKPEGKKFVAMVLKSAV